MVPLTVVELAAQLVPKEGNQIATIGQKLRLRNVVFLGQTIEKRRRGTGPAAAVYVNFQQDFRLRVSRCVQPFLLTIKPLNGCRRRIVLRFGEIVRPVPDHPMRAVDTE